MLCINYILTKYKVKDYSLFSNEYCMKFNSFLSFCQREIKMELLSNSNLVLATLEGNRVVNCQIGRMKGRD